ncbi:T9SS type A sorting domain-containing protein [Taibaiella koreensis]|uniref:T9SS type A sorting domain-containing protein n=1 Tax=Taibaiella koreensis TaxID=1268548 RepID=UPI000E59EE3F|nr:T9SS type A sorting domain-containing protein [Taibaiella koreensis]
MRNQLINWSLLLYLCCCMGTAAAQSGFDKLINYSPTLPSPIYISRIHSLYADTQSIFAIGMTIRDTLDFSPTGTSTFISSINYSGNVQWKKNITFPANTPYRGNEPYLFNLIAKVRPGKYVVGSSGSDCASLPGYCMPRPFLYFFNSMGDSLRFVPVPNGNNQNTHLFCALMVDKQYNVITTGTYWNKPMMDTAGIWLAKFDSSGNYLWRKVIVDTPFYRTRVQGYKIINGNDNDYIVAGLSGDRDTIHKSCYTLWKIDTAGNVLWRKSIPKTPQWASDDFYGNDIFFDVVRANNGSGYYFMGVAPMAVPFPGEPGTYKTIYYCGKLNEQGDVAWAKTYQRDILHEERCTALMQKSNGDLVFMGQSNGANHGGPSLFCTDSIGRLKWFKETKRYNCPFELGQFLYSMKLTPHGGIARGGVIGQQTAQPPCFDTAGGIAWLVLTDSLGRRTPTDTVTFPIITDSVRYPADTTTAILVPDDDKPTIRLYPNPTAGTVYLEVANLPGSPGLITVQLFDYMGRRLQQQKLSTARTTIDLGPYPPGLYLLRLRYKDSDAGVQKVMKR